MGGGETDVWVGGGVGGFGGVVAMALGGGLGLGGVERETLHYGRDS